MIAIIVNRALVLYRLLAIIVHITMVKLYMWLGIVNISSGITISN